MQSKMFKGIVKVGISAALAVFCLSTASCQQILDALFAKEPAVVTVAEPLVTLRVGDTYRLKGEASDGDALSWLAAQEGVVEIVGDRMTAIAEGKATVTGYCAHAQATCIVTVEASPSVDPGTDQPPAQTPKRELVWHDEFEGNALDLTKWGYQLGRRDEYGESTGPQDWGNNEQQYYTEDAVSVWNGMLEITATKEERGGKAYTSGRILTRDLATFTYGYFEAKIKVPAITGMWPAFWMLPQPGDPSGTNNVYGGWAKSGEIDIMEIRGRNANESTCALHFGGGWPNNTHKGSEYKLSTPIDEWHIYAVEWTETYITWYVDDTPFFTLQSDEWWTESSTKAGAPFDQPFFLLLNLAVGGNFDGNRLPPDDFTSAAMYVDYVRVYQYL